jgi:hypothetical protein
VPSTAHLEQSTKVAAAHESYHLESVDEDTVPSISLTAHVGTGSTARLVQCFLVQATEWCMLQNIPLPRHPPHQAPLLDEISDPQAAQSFNVNNDVRKTELHTILPPSTQRNIIEHYSRVVSEQYTILPADQLSRLLTHENPLKWAGSNKDDSATAMSLSIVLAISTALIARDLDPILVNVALRCRDDVEKLSVENDTAQDPLAQAKQSCTAMCALALCELIYPITGQIWDLLGRAQSIMENLQQGLLVNRSSFDSDLLRLEHALLKLER